MIPAEIAARVAMAAVLLVMWLGTLACILYVFQFLLTIPMRRSERARLFLNVLEVNIQQGQPIEGAIVDLSNTGEESLGARFHLLAAHIENGSKLGAALETVPRFLPPQISAMLRVGEKLGDLKKVLPACQQLLNDSKDSAQSAFHYLLLLVLVFSPSIIFATVTLIVFVFPRMIEIAAAADDGQIVFPPIVLFGLHHSSWIIAGEISVLAFLLGIGLIYIGGPRFARWFRFRNFPVVDWLAWHLPWKRKRLQRTFSAMLSVLLDEGVPDVEAVRLAGDCTANEICCQRAQRIIDQIKKGVRLDEAVSAFDDHGEFQWRLSNAIHSRGGFLKALRGWHESLDAKAFQQEESTAHVVTSGLVILNGVMIGLIAVSVFGVLIAILKGVIP